jgi:hypothetical protein
MSPWGGAAFTSGALYPKCSRDRLAPLSGLQAISYTPPGTLRASPARQDRVVGGASLQVEPARRHTKVCCLGTSMKSPVPDREDELGVANDKGAGKMDSVGPPE